MTRCLRRRQTVTLVVTQPLLQLKKTSQKAIIPWKVQNKTRSSCFTILLKWPIRVFGLSAGETAPLTADGGSGSSARKATIAALQNRLLLSSFVYINSCISKQVTCAVHKDTNTKRISRYTTWSCISEEWLSRKTLRLSSKSSQPMRISGAWVHAPTW